MALRIVLVRPKEAANIGSVARALKNFGLDDLVLVSPRCAIGPRAYALASHAADVLNRTRVVANIGEAVADCTMVLGTTARRREAPWRCYTPREAVQELPEQGAAVLFGPEDHGLSNEDLDSCQGLITIPTAEYASLNLAHAVQIVAYEWFQQRLREPVPSPATPLAERQVLEGMYEHLKETLYLIGYTDPQREKAAMRFFRRVFDAAQLSHNDVLTLRGLWRQVQWAVTHGPPAAQRQRKRDAKKS